MQPNICKFTGKKGHILHRNFTLFTFYMDKFNKQTICTFILMLLNELVKRTSSVSVEDSSSSDIFIVIYIYIVL